MAYSAKNVITDGAATVSVTASQTDAVLTGNGSADAFTVFNPTAFRCDIVVSAITVATAVTAKLQHRFSSAQDWVDAKTLALTTTGIKSISLLDTVVADQTHLPLRPLARVVVTTGAGDSLTVTAVWVQSV